MIDSTTVEITDQRVPGVRERASAFIELTKPRIAFMLVLTSAAGFYLASSGSFNWLLFSNAIIGIALLAFGVATLNQFIEGDIDKLMERTAGRPIPSGRLTTVEAVVFGVLQCAVAEIYLYFLVNTITAFLGFVVILGYVFLYTPLKTRTSASTAIGAIPGAMPPLMGWTAAADNITLGAWSLFVILFLWQFPHFLAIATIYKDEYAKAGIKMLPVLEADGKITARQIVSFAFMLFAISFAPFFLGIVGSVYPIVAAVLGLWFLFESLKTARARTKESSRRLLFVSVIYLPLIFGLMVVTKL